MASATIRGPQGERWLRRLHGAAAASAPAPVVELEPEQAQRLEGPGSAERLANLREGFARASRRAMRPVKAFVSTVVFASVGIMLGIVAVHFYDTGLIHQAALAVKVQEITKNDDYYFPDCAAARQAGAAPVSVWEPGYGEHLDADRDGVGCEPVPAP